MITSDSMERVKINPKTKPNSVRVEVEGWKENDKIIEKVWLNAFQQ